MQILANANFFQNQKSHLRQKKIDFMEKNTCKKYQNRDFVNYFEKF